MTWIFNQPHRGGVRLPLDSFDKNSQMVEMCYRTHTTTVNPIIDWDDAEVWEFIHEYNVPYCHLYDEGFKRLGCIGCPMGSKQQRQEEFERYPKYKALYLKAFEKMIDNRNLRGGVQGKNRHTTECRTGNEWLHNRTLSAKWGGSTSLYPYAQTRSEKDFGDMTPEEIMDWWID